MHLSSCAAFVITQANINNIIGQIFITVDSRSVYAANHSIKDWLSIGQIFILDTPLLEVFVLEMPNETAKGCVVGSQNEFIRLF